MATTNKSKLVILQLLHFLFTMLRVFICGAHSVGKTTLVNEVGKRKDVIHYKNVAGYPSLAIKRNDS